jgi:hypothetical protein
MENFVQWITMRPWSRNLSQRELPAFRKRPVVRAASKRLFMSDKSSTEPAQAVGSTPFTLRFAISGQKSLTFPALASERMRSPATGSED